MAETLSANEAQKISLDFIQEKYYRGKATVSDTKLVTGGAFPLYHCVGTVKMKPRGVMGRFVSTEDPFSFSVKVHALDGSIVSYELR